MVPGRDDGTGRGQFGTFAVADLIAARHTASRFQRDLRQRSHAGTANSDKM